MLLRSSRYLSTAAASYTARVRETFRERLRRLRNERGLRVGDLAGACRVTEAAIRKMESGETKSASFGVGLMLSRELRVNPWYLCFGDDGVVLETGVRSEEAAAKALESLLLERAARDQRVSTLEARVAALERRKARAD
jgi:transcriptional regulator with XRE-family HTH domain